MIISNNFQMLEKHPLFHGNTNEEVLQEIELFHLNLNQLKSKAQLSNIYDEKLWEFTISLLQTDPQKRLSTKEAKPFLENIFPKKLFVPTNK
jgi:hypothetical protein